MSKPNEIPKTQFFFHFVANQLELESKDWFFVSGKELKPQTSKAKQNWQTLPDSNDFELDLSLFDFKWMKVQK